MVKGSDRQAWLSSAMQQVRLMYALRNCSDACPPDQWGIGGRQGARSRESETVRRRRQTLTLTRTEPVGKG